MTSVSITKQMVASERRRAIIAGIAGIAGIADTADSAGN
jgi:hypothetical protein